MGRVVLVTGGVRAGKSAYAQRRAEACGTPRVFLATAQALDEEMAERIRKHRQDRDGAGWSTIEEPLDISGAIEKSSDARVVLIDCLTLWISNLMHAAQELTESDVASHTRRLLEMCSRVRCDSIFVTNEVGLGVMPENRLARRYADLLGRCNQTIAAGADEVVLLVSGVPLVVKTGNRNEAA